MQCEKYCWKQLPGTILGGSSAEDPLPNRKKMNKSATRTLVAARVQHAHQSRIFPPFEV